MSGARPFPAAETATQPQERLRDALAILHVLRGETTPADDREDQGLKSTAMIAKR